MIRRTDVNAIFALNGSRLFLLAMMGRGYTLADIAYTMGYTQGWATTEKNKLEKVFNKKPMFEHVKIESWQEVRLTDYGKVIAKVCDEFFLKLYPDMGEPVRKPRKRRYESWEC